MLMIVEMIKWRTDLVFERGSGDQLLLVDQIVGLLLIVGRCVAFNTVRRAELLASTVETVLYTVSAAPDAGGKTFANRRFTCCSRWKSGGRRCSWTIEKRSRVRVEKVVRSIVEHVLEDRLRVLVS